MLTRAVVSSGRQVRTTAVKALSLQVLVLALTSFACARKGDVLLAPAGDGGLFARDATVADVRHVIPRADAFARDGATAERGLAVRFSFEEGRGFAVRGDTGAASEGVLINGAGWTDDVPDPLQGSSRTSLTLGERQYLHVDQNLGSYFARNVTLSVWVRTKQTGPAKLPAYSPALVSSTFLLGVLDEQGRIGMLLGAAKSFSTNSISDDKWHHVALTYESNPRRIQVYADGVPAEFGAPDVDPPGDDVFDLLLSSMRATLVGRFDDLRLYDRALSPDEVFNLAAGLNADGSEIQ